jgi:hypothetical protein
VTLVIAGGEGVADPEQPEIKQPAKSAERLTSRKMALLK